MLPLFSNLFIWGFAGNYLVFNPDLTNAVRVFAFVASVFIIIMSSYLLGSLNFAIIISGRQYNQDIRSYGSKNAGMTNMMRTYGKKAAALTLVGDMLKAVVSCIIGYLLLGLLGAHIAGLFCVVGHVFPLYYKFRGGKGVATAAMVILMCNPLVFAILLLIFVLIVLGTKYISVGSIMCVMLYPILLDRFDKWMYGGSYGVLFAILITILVVFKHWSNIKRLKEGTENKFSFKKSVKKSDMQNIEVNENEGEKDA
ncbi:MAG: glycerol-3-phosphate 1-O-acyltransferase PlsY [Ruminococcaceae bacterium]|nr:glycerol-3-phosphate 1-O-acyltransferase PlsY [Oscillospiraceae bacterium]